MIHIVCSGLEHRSRHFGRIRRPRTGASRFAAWLSRYHTVPLRPRSFSRLAVSVPLLSEAGCLTRFLAVPCLGQVGYVEHLGESASLVHGCSIIAAKGLTAYHCR